MKSDNRVGRLQWNNYEDSLAEVQESQGALEPVYHAQAWLRAEVVCGLGQPTDLAWELGSACC